LSVVIPTFDEEHRLPDTLDRLSGLGEVFAGAWEVIVSDDGSTDRTADLARDRAAADPCFRVLDHDVNRGKGAALAAGFLAARHELVLFVDADLPISLDEIPRLVAAADGVDVVAGSRRLPGAHVEPAQPLGRRLGGRCFLLAVRAMGLAVSSDPQCGVKVLRRESADHLVRSHLNDRFAFDVELLVRADRSGLVIRDEPLSWRHVEGSTLRPLPDALSTLRDLARLRSCLRSEARALGAPGMLEPPVVASRVRS
jgi:glycosyltransferase involved in cell wall biosynthesis